jgi:glycosyltransferase involved in cell wall biosynthesis
MGWEMRMSAGPTQTVVHLAASPFFGGPERQMLGLAQALPATYRSVFLSFAERGLAQPFLEGVRNAGFAAHTLRENTPHLVRAAREVAGHLRRERAAVLCCNGYKPDIIGWLAARQAQVPVVCVAHGWTAASRKVRLYELADRWVMRWSDCTVCVSAAMATKVRQAGVPASRMVVIRNAIQTANLERPDPAYHDLLRGFFTQAPAHIVVAAGRLSPEKGFDQLVEACSLLHREHRSIGFVLFGDGPLRQALTEQIAARQLQQTFLLAGFRTDVERFLPYADLAVNSSFTEGLPVVVLEALAAGVPVVATAVGGTPEVIDDGVHGFLVPAGDAAALAHGIWEALSDEKRRQSMGQRGRQRVQAEFTFAIQARQYQELFARLIGKRAADRSAALRPRHNVATCNGALL